MKIFKKIMFFSCSVLTLSGISAAILTTSQYTDKIKNSTKNPTANNLKNSLTYKAKQNIIVQNIEDFYIGGVQIIGSWNSYFNDRNESLILPEKYILKNELGHEINIKGGSDGSTFHIENNQVRITKIKNVQIKEINIQQSWIDFEVEGYTGRNDLDYGNPNYSWYTEIWSEGTQYIPAGWVKKRESRKAVKRIHFHTQENTMWRKEYHLSIDEANQCDKFSKYYTNPESLRKLGTFYSKTIQNPPIPNVMKPTSSVKYQMADTYLETINMSVKTKIWYNGEIIDKTIHVIFSGFRKQASNPTITKLQTGNYNKLPSTVLHDDVLKYVSIDPDNIPNDNWKYEVVANDNLGELTINFKSNFYYTEDKIVSTTDFQTIKSKTLNGFWTNNDPTSSSTVWMEEKANIQNELERLPSKLIGADNNTLLKFVEIYGNIPNNQNNSQIELEVLPSGADDTNGLLTIRLSLWSYYGEHGVIKTTTNKPFFVNDLTIDGFWTNRPKTIVSLSKKDAANYDMLPSSLSLEKNNLLKYININGKDTIPGNENEHIVFNITNNDINDTKGTIRVELYLTEWVDNNGRIKKEPLPGKYFAEIKLDGFYTNQTPTKTSLKVTQKNNLGVLLNKLPSKISRKSSELIKYLDISGNVPDNANNKRVQIKVVESTIDDQRGCLDLEVYLTAWYDQNGRELLDQNPRLYKTVTLSGFYTNSPKTIVTLKQKPISKAFDMLPSEVEINNNNILENYIDANGLDTIPVFDNVKEWYFVEDKQGPIDETGQLQLTLTAFQWIDENGRYKTSDTGISLAKIILNGFYTNKTPTRTSLKVSQKINIDNYLKDLPSKVNNNNENLLNYIDISGSIPNNQNNKQILLEIKEGSVNDYEGSLVINFKLKQWYDNNGRIQSNPLGEFMTEIKIVDFKTTAPTTVVQMKENKNADTNILPSSISNTTEALWNYVSITGLETIPDNINNNQIKLVIPENGFNDKKGTITINLLLHKYIVDGGWKEKSEEGTKFSSVTIDGFYTTNKQTEVKLTNRYNEVVKDLFPDQIANNFDELYSLVDIKFINGSTIPNNINNNQLSLVIMPNSANKYAGTLEIGLYIKQWYNHNGQTIISSEPEGTLVDYIKLTGFKKTSKKNNVDYIKIGGVSLAVIILIIFITLIFYFSKSLVRN